MSIVNDTETAFHKQAVSRLEAEGGRPAPPKKGFDVREEEKAGMQTSLATWPRNEVVQLMDKTPIKTVVADRTYITTQPRRDYIGAMVITVNDSDTLQRVVQTLTKHRISCAPVIAPSQDPDSPGQFLGFIDFLDVVTFIASSGPKDISKAEISDKDQAALARLVMSTTARHLMDKSHKDAPHPVFEDAPMTQAVELMAKGVHRVPLFSAQKRVVGLCSQFDVVQYLSQQFAAGKAPGMASRTLESYGAASKKTWGPQLGSVLSISPTATVYYAITKMAMTGAQVLAVVDDAGALVGNFSVQDIGRAFFDQKDPLLVTQWFALTVETFLETFAAEIMKPLFELPTLTLGAACKMLSDVHGHHLWIVDGLETMKPIGLMTLTDVCRVVTDFQWPEWQKLSKYELSMGEMGDEDREEAGMGA